MNKAHSQTEKAQEHRPSGKMAGPLAPPDRGIDAQAVEYPYVRL